MPSSIPRQAKGSFGAVARAYFVAIVGQARNEKRNSRCRRDADCDDGDLCNGLEHCDEGTCKTQPGTVPNCDDGDPCTDDVCNEADASCSNPLLFDPAVECCDPADNGARTTLDDANPCTVDSCSLPGGRGTAVHTNAPDHTPCPNGTVCDGRETCQAGVCLPGAQPDCDDGNPCTTDGCDPVSGCTHTNNAAACNDGSDCTTGDQCSGGTCTGTPIAGCTDCVDDTDCDNDGNACNGREECRAGICVFIPPVLCDDGEPCTDDSCDPSTGLCVHSDVTDGTPCPGDGVFCNGAEVCSGGVCGSPGDPCAGGPDCANVCDEAGRTCRVPKGTACSDDGNVCTDDVCDGAGMCVHPANSDPCDDGLFCTLKDICRDGVCVGMDSPCIPGLQCADTCDEVNDTCNLPAGTACTDGNACTRNECDGNGSCKVSVNLSGPCDDHNPCTDAQCVGGVCVGTPDNTNSCDDGLLCTGSETCVNGTCVHTGDPCDDGNPCTEDLCGEISGCTHEPDDAAACDDGLFCNGADSCSEGACAVHTGDPCAGGDECADVCDEINDTCNLPAGTLCADDGNVCTDNECDGAGACVITNNTDPCDDGLFCTLNDVCLNGVCEGSGDPCAASGGACNEVLDTCGFGIAGTATTHDGTGAAGVLIVFTGTGASAGLDFSIATDAAGDYLQSVPDGWSGVVSSNEDHRLEPVLRTYSNVNADFLGQDFAAFRNWYVDNPGDGIGLDGDDANPGTFAAPFATIQAAADVVNPGDTAYVKAGTYREWAKIRRSGTLNQRILFRNFADDRVVIDAEGTRFGCIMIGNVSVPNQGDFVTVDGLELMNTTTVVSGPSDRGAAASMFHVENAVFRNLRVHDCGFFGIQLKGRVKNCTVEYCEAFRCGRGGIFSSGTSDVFAGDPVGLTKSLPERVTIDNCLVYNSNADAEDADGIQILLATQFDRDGRTLFSFGGHRLTNNIVHHNSDDGIDATSVNGVSFLHNIIFQNGDIRLDPPDLQGCDAGINVDLDPLMTEIGGTISVNGTSMLVDWDRIGDPLNSVPAELFNERIYVDLHTDANLLGEIRGQLIPRQPQGAAAILSGGDVVPPVVTAAAGNGTFTFNANQSVLTVDISTAGLSGPITSATLNNAAAGGNGDVVFDFFSPGPSDLIAVDAAAGTVSGTTLFRDWTNLPVADPTNTSQKRAEAVRRLVTGNLYVVLGTAANPSGEIRGQLVTSAITFDAVLEGAQEIPPVATAASGTGTFVLSADQTALTVDITGIQTSDLSGAVTGVHFHNKEAGKTADDDGCGDGNAIKVSTNSGGDHTVAFNIMFNNERGGLDQDITKFALHNRFYNNLAYGSGRGLILDTGGRIGPDTAAVVLNNILASNISVDNIFGSTPEDYFFSDAGDQPMAIKTSDFNFVSDGLTRRVQIPVREGSGTIGDGDPMFNNPPPPRADKTDPFDPNLVDTTDQGDLVVTMDFIRRQVYDMFSLAPGSPCIDAGFDINAVFDVDPGGAVPAGFGAFDDPTVVNSPPAPKMVDLDGDSTPETAGSTEFFDIGPLERGLPTVSFLPDLAAVDSRSTSTVNEGVAGGTHSVSVLLSFDDSGGGLPEDVTVDVIDLTGSAHSREDYEAPRATLTFPAGSANGTTVDYTFSLHDDVRVEGSETVRLGLHSVTGPAMLAGPTLHTVTINDND